MLILLIVLLILFVGLAAFVNSSETALLSLSASKVRSYKNDPDPKKKLIGDLLKAPQDFLTTVIIVNIVVNIFIQNVVSSIFGTYSGYLFTVGVPLCIVLIFGEILPKSFGLANNEKVACMVAPIIFRIQKLLYPIRKAAKSVAGFVSRFMFFFLRKDQEISAHELRHVLLASKAHGVLSDEEAEITEGFLTLQESIVKEIMRPREEILFFNIEEDITKLQHLIVDMECSRLPVCQGHLDALLGVISSEIFFLNKDKIVTSKDLIPFLKKPLYVPESSPAEVLLKRMYEKKESFAIVVDEYGSLSGLITLEDMVEIVIGEIIDRRDEKERYTKSSEDSIIASGKLEITDFEELFDIELDSEHNMVTIGGWLTEQLGDIPKAGTKFTTAGFLFQVLSADNKRVKRIYIRRLSKKDEGEEGEFDGE